MFTGGSLMLIATSYPVLCVAYGCFPSFFAGQGIVFSCVFGTPALSLLQ